MTKHSQLKKSCDQLQLGWVQATFMITVHSIHSWGDRQLQFQRHSASLVLSSMYYKQSYRSCFRCSIKNSRKTQIFDIDKEHKNSKTT